MKKSNFFALTLLIAFGFIQGCSENGNANLLKNEKAGSDVETINDVLDVSQYDKSLPKIKADQTKNRGAKKSFDQVVTFAYPDDGVVIGQGWDSFSERGTASRCVDVIEVPIETSSFSNDFKEIKSTFSLFKKQTISIAASGSYGGFSGSGSYSSKKSHKLDTEKINLLYEFRSNIAGTRAIGLPEKGPATSNIITEISRNKGFQILKEAPQVSVVDSLLLQPLPATSYQIKLSDSARKFASSNDSKGFRAICGDGFVSAIQRGTEVKVLATYRNPPINNGS